MNEQERRKLIEQVTAKDILRIALLNGVSVGSRGRYEGEYIEPDGRGGFRRVYWYWYDDDNDTVTVDVPFFLLDAAIDRLDNPIQAAANYLADIPVIDFGEYEYGD